MRRMTALALVVALALLGAACGGDDDDAGDDDVEATDDGGTTDDGSEDGGGDGDALAAALGGFGGCAGAVTAMATVISAGFNPNAAAMLEDWSEYFDDFVSSAPDEIKEDVELIREYAAARQEKLEDFTVADQANPAKAPEIQAAYAELEEDYPSEDLNEANEALSTWLTDECPKLAGDG